MKSKPRKWKPGARWRPFTRWGLSLALALAAMAAWGLLLGREAPPVHRQAGSTMALVRVAPAQPPLAGEPRPPAAPAPRVPGPETAPEPSPPSPGMAREQAPPPVPHAAHAPPWPENPPGPAALAATGRAPADPPPDDPPEAEPPPPPDETGALAAGKLAAHPVRESRPPQAEPPGGETAVDQALLDRGFRLLAPVRPAYPAQARRLGRGGEVRLEAMVDPQGRVRRVDIMDETGGWGFGDAVRAAYRRARFSPPTRGGRPVWVVWRKTLRFAP